MIETISNEKLRKTAEMWMEFARLNKVAEVPVVVVTANPRIEGDMARVSLVYDMGQQGEPVTIELETLGAALAHQAIARLRQAQGLSSIPDIRWERHAHWLEQREKSASEEAADRLKNAPQTTKEVGGPVAAHPGHFQMLQNREPGVRISEDGKNYEAVAITPFLRLWKLIEN